MDDRSNEQSPSIGGNKPASEPFHCPYRQASLLQQALSPDKMRVAFFLGAGCPSGVELIDSDGKKPLIPAILGLTDQVLNKIKATEQEGVLSEIVNRLVEDGTRNPNIEDILTHIRLTQEVIGKRKFGNSTLQTLSEIDKTICQTITEIVDVRLPERQSPYHNLAKWIRSIPRRQPIEIFTSNYDLLMEQALEEYRVPYFDGFVGANRPFFDVASMEQDEMPQRWARLWKLHGSINWWRTKDDNVERHREPANTDDRQMIYPSIRKYDQTRRMPFVAMMERLRAFLRTGQAVLITSGYSFSDDHINDVIMQGLTANPNAICFGMIWGDRKSIPDEVINQAQTTPNLSILAADGAVIGGFDRKWRSELKKEDPMHELAVSGVDMKPRSQAPLEQCKFLLGDFMALGSFLANLTAQERSEDGARYGQ